nr:formamidopyrimidine DNA glycosylase [Gammaproteobacteria bacterium]
MPEGDTLEKIARYLRARLIGKTIVTGRMRPDSGQLLAGERINAVQAHGKHLFIRFRSGWGVRTHLGMTGSWHRYSRSEKWQRPVTQASLILQFTDAIYVCFNAKEVQALTDGGIHERSLLRRLGPDLSEENCDLSTIVSRVRHQDGASPVIDILLDQSVA